MLRPSYIGALSVALLTGTLAAQMAVTIERTPLPDPTASHARVQNVLVRGAGEDMEVEIQISGATIDPNTQAITGPDRIVIDFPGALPASQLRALKVNRGVLKGVRSGLFFSNPPITRIVLDLAEPQSYRVSSIHNAVVVKLGPATPTIGSTGQAVGGVRLRDASVSSGSNVPAARISAAIYPAVAKPIAVGSTGVSNANTRSVAHAAPAVPQPAKPRLSVTYENGMLRIHAEESTLSEVLFEVHLRTQAEIAIPAGAEQEQVIADLGPAPARDVLSELLNGSPYNFVFVGDELALERVILSRRDSSNF